MTIAELRKSLMGVTLKTNQDPADLFEELAPMEHAYLNAQDNLGNRDLVGVVFAEPAERYHTLLTILES